MHVSIRLHSSTISENSCLFVGLIGFVIPIKWNRCQLFILSNCSHQHGSWVAHVCTENLCAYNQNRHTCTTTKSKVNLRVSSQSVLHRYKAPCQLLLNLSWVHHSLWNFCLIKRILNRLFNVEPKLCLHKLWYLLAKDTMAIANCKKVSPSILTEVGQYQVRVLVSLAWIFWAKTSFCSEAKLSDAVIKLLRRLIIVLTLLPAWLLRSYLLSSGNLSSDRGTQRIFPFAFLLFLMNWSAIILLCSVWFTLIYCSEVWLLVRQISGWATSNNIKTKVICLGNIFFSNETLRRFLWHQFVWG